MEEFDIDVTADPAALYRQLTETARYAVPHDFEYDEDYDDVVSADWKSYGDEQGTLEALRQFRGMTLEEQFGLLMEHDEAMGENVPDPAAQGQQTVES